VLELEATDETAVLALAEALPPPAPVALELLALPEPPPAPVPVELLVPLPVLVLVPLLEVVPMVLPMHTPTVPPGNIMVVLSHLFPPQSVSSQQYFAQIPFSLGTQVCPPLQNPAF
jgi:hypothetical protein